MYSKNRKKIMFNYNRINFPNRDSFITKLDKYRWAEPFTLYRDDLRPTVSSTSYSMNYGSSYSSNVNNGNQNNNNNGTYKLHETVPDYFSGAVLQRHHLNEPDSGVVTLKFQVAFNLAVVWMIVFVSLSKGEFSMLMRL